jgi:hypothetical protein
MHQSSARTEYRRKALDCLARARALDDPEKRMDLLWLAKMWMSLTEPLGDMPGAYEIPQNGSVPPDSGHHGRYRILARSRNMVHQNDGR